jgi:hypothetical protein
MPSVDDNIEVYSQSKTLKNVSLDSSLSRRLWTEAYRMISSKSRPTDAGYSNIARIILLGSIMNTVRI